MTDYFVNYPYPEDFLRQATILSATDAVSIKGVSAGYLRMGKGEANITGFLKEGDFVIDVSINGGVGWSYFNPLKNLEKFDCCN